MYTITKTLDGKFYCEFRLQDGTERYVEETLEDAIVQAKSFARVMNGTNLTNNGISFLQERQITQVVLDNWKPKLPKQEFTLTLDGNELYEKLRPEIEKAVKAVVAKHFGVV